LARADGAADRFYTMSAQIEAERRDYYDVLEKSQKGDLDLTAWNRLLDGFEGYLTTSKYAKLAHCSSDTNALTGTLQTAFLPILGRL
jgi:Fic family protein